ncbi:MAG TPA: hypothetical protein VGP82_14815 [Ktedonobacterales bacterium]|nr:hypothetical protein [Ktedonobacterales bacterium]
MPGASKETRRVKLPKATWVPDGAGEDGLFEVMMVTADDQQYLVQARPGSMTALVAPAKADTVMAWDRLNQSLIVANIVPTMPGTAGGGP